MDRLYKFETISDYNEFVGLETLHPLVNVIDMSQVESIREGRKYFGFYCVMLKDLKCGSSLTYGRRTYDFQEGTLVFLSPGQVAGVDGEGEIRGLKGWSLLFHPDLLLGTTLRQKMKNYSFFSYDVNEGLHISQKERETVLHCLSEIRDELQGHVIDRHSKEIIVSNIELLLNYCVRFYDRQFITREVMNRDIIVRFEELLARYFDSDEPKNVGLPTVKYCADKLCLSSNYFGDLIKKTTGNTAQEYIRNAIVGRVKEALYDTDKTISEIAYGLGFQYPHHLSRLFKEKVGCTPNEFRAQA